MRVGVATVTSPGIEGGAEMHARSLATAMREAGHIVQTIDMPFYYTPGSAIVTAMGRWEAMDFGPYGGGQIDRLVCLKFPSYGIGHPNKVTWLLHQHRPVYDLWGTPFGPPPDAQDSLELRTKIEAFDARHLGVGPVFANSRRVAERLMQFNGIASRPLYHPPMDADRFRCFPAEPYIFCPSRMETLKRQDLLIRAMRNSKSPLTAVFAGAGGQADRIARIVKELGVGDKVRMLGHASREELIGLYANALAVFFGPQDEDLGYVTMEAMLSGKPVITCTDSGGPLEFVVDGETGLIVPPEPQAIADAIDRLASAPAWAAQLGQNGRERFLSLGISWQDVVEKLCAATPLGAAA